MSSHAWTWLRKGLERRWSAFQQWFRRGSVESDSGLESPAIGGMPRPQEPPPTKVGKATRTPAASLLPELLNHIVSAVIRYTEVKGSRLAAALTYRSFLTVFPMLLLAFSMLGFVLHGNPDTTEKVTRYLQENIPTLKTDSIAEGRLTAGIIGVIGVLFAGLFWIEEIRATVRAMWRKAEDPGSFLLSKAVDAVVMLTLGGVVLISMIATLAVTSGASWLLELVHLPKGIALQVLGLAVGVIANMVLFYLLLTFVPRLSMTVGRFWWPVLLGGLGFEVLKQFTHLFVGYAVNNPAYAVVATAVGLLLFFNFFNQLLLFCAALTATSTHGPVRDKTLVHELDTIAP